MTTIFTRGRAGMTVIEFLVLLAVVTVLVILFIPEHDNALQNARRVTASAKARQIAQTYGEFSKGDGTKMRTIATPPNGGGQDGETVATSINGVAYILAKQAQLNDTSVWFIKQDEALIGANFPKTVIAGNITTATDASKAFKDIHPKSWAFVTGMSINAAPATTPLLWTYGLQTTGVWNKISSWQGAGGHIAFLDGHVEWADKLTTEADGTRLTVYAENPNPSTPTANYKEAINSSGQKPAVVVNAECQDR